MAKRWRIAAVLFFAFALIPFSGYAWTHYFDHNLAYGTTGADVSFLQQYLTEQGYFHHSITNYFGPITLAAVKTWQGANGIPNTGFFGPLSRAFVNATTTVPSVVPTSTPVVGTTTIGGSGGFSTPSSSTSSTPYCPRGCGGVTSSPGIPVPPPVYVSINSPATTTLMSDSVTAFTATVSNASNAAVAWSAIYGTINATSGVYTAPSILGTSTIVDVITATSQQDPTQSATINITITSALLGYWPLDEATGTVAFDESGNGLNGNWSGAMASPSSTYYTSVAVVGPSSGYFNGVDDYIDMGNSTVFNAQSVTLSSWVYPTAFSGQNIIMGKELQYKYTIDSGRFTILSTCFGGEGWTVDTSVATATLDTWQNVTFVEDADNAIDQFYLNGQLLYSTSTCGAVDNFDGDDFEIGAYSGATAPFQGMIDDARLYGRALTAGEVQSLYTAHTPPVSVSITPASTSTLSAATTTFSATFYNDPGDIVRWSASAGSIDPASGAYTAPTVYATTTVTIYAQSETIAAVSSTAMVTVIPRTVTISISPMFALNVNGGDQIPFMATVTHGSTSTVTWSALLGTINASGLYTAPLSPPDGGTDTVTATSVADPTKSATATVNFTASLFGS